MEWTLATIVTQLLLIVLPGLVLHRALATRLFAIDAKKYPDSDVAETDLLAYGILPGLAIINTFGTALAMFGLFQTWIYTAIVGAAVIWRWRDAVATFSAIGQIFGLGWQSLARGNLMVVVAAGILLKTTFGLLLVAQIPSENVDVWNHNFPLAQSIVSHHGFVMPQIGNMFYGSYPIFFHMFFAEALLFINNIVAAKVANAIIYLGFLVSLISFAPRGRSIATLLVFIFIIDSPFYSLGAADAMTDIGRVCYSALAFGFAYFYLWRGRAYFLCTAGLLAGGAAAGKYTELLTPFLIGLTLLPGVVRRGRDGWLALALFVAAASFSGSYPYLRNIILLHNPIYPFLLGHPGLSEQYMAGLNSEVFHALNPTYRNYVQNLFVLDGWRDFGRAAQELFLGNKSIQIFGVIGVGLAMRKSPLIYLVVWTLFLAIFWYIVGNMNTRWGLTAYMVLLVTEYLSAALILDWAVRFFEREGHDWVGVVRLVGAKMKLVANPSWLTPYNLARAALIVFAVMISAAAVQRVYANGVAGMLPAWANSMRPVFQGGGINAYLSRTRRGYAMYRYVGERDLKTVFQPFDNGVGFYQAAYNGGRNGEWFHSWYDVPHDTAEFDAFRKRNDIKYFVYREALDPIEIERLGEGSNNPQHVAMSYRFINYLLPHSRVLLTDHFGWQLRAVDGAVSP